MEYDRVKEQEMKDKSRNEYFRRAKLILKSKLNGRNKIMALNTWAVSILRYGAGILKWNKNELQEMDRKTRKFMTMNKELHPRSDVARLYVSQKNGGRGLIGCENVKSEKNGLGWYVKNNIEPLLVAVRTSRTITHEETVDPKEFKKTKEEQRKNEWTAKRMHGQFARDMEDKDKNNTWRWMRKSDLKGCTEALTCSAQEQSIRTNCIKYNIDKTVESPLCRMCGTRNETISHIVSECGKLAQKEYKRRHDNVGRYVYWQFCEKLGFNRARLWYEHEPESVVENKNFKILWDFIIQCDHMIGDIVVVDKVKKETMIIDVAIPGHTRLCDKKREKIEKYSLLKDKIGRLWQIKKVVVIPIVVGALGTITTKLEKYIESFGIEIRIEHVQKSALLGTARIIRKVLYCKVLPGATQKRRLL